MILYVTGRNHTNLLDFLGDGHPCNKMEGQYYLAQWLHDIRGFAHVTELVLDRQAFYEDDGGFASAVERLLLLHGARVTVLLFGTGADSPAVAALLGCGVTNIVTATEPDDVRDEIRECLSPDGMARFGTGRGRAYRFRRTGITAAVTGSQPRIGVTNTALGFAKWLTGRGAGVAVITGEYARMGRYLELAPSGEGFLWQGIHVGGTLPEGDFTFVIHDGGTGRAAPDLTVGVCGFKAYEMEHTLRFLNPLGQTKNSHLAVNFLHEESHGDIRASLRDVIPDVPVGFLSYMPDPEYPEGNGKLFRRFIEEFII